MPFIPTIYCQLGFLEKLLSSTSDTLNDWLTSRISEIDSITACFKLIYGPAKIYVDATDQELLNHKNPLVKKLWKNQTARVICKPNFSKEIDHDSINKEKSLAMFMLNLDNDSAETLENNWGVLVLTPENLIQKHAFLNASTPIFVKANNTAFNWDKLSHLKHYFHSAIIVDNYLDHNTDVLNANLLPLIRALFKGKLHKEHTHLLIATSKSDITRLHANLQKLLSKEGIEIDLRIIKVQTLQNHDRHLITNQLWVSSGYGFNLLKHDQGKQKLKSIRETTIMIHPVFFSASILSYNNDNQEFTQLAAMEIWSKLAKLDEEADLPRGNEAWSIGNKNERIRLEQ